MKSKIFTRSLAFFLAFLMAFYAIPTAIFAEFSGSTYSQEEILNEENAVTREIYEVEDERRENVKIFKMPDGSYTAAKYATAIHRLDENGKWEDINNVLVKSGSEYATSDTRVKFAKKTTGDESLFTLHERNQKITFSLDGAKKKTEGEISQINEFENADELSKLTSLEKLSSRIIYRDILDGVDVEYIVFANDIKENIIVKEKSDNYEYHFTLKLNNLTAELSSDGSINFLNAEGEIEYKIPAPIIYDSQGAYAAAGVGEYSLSDNGNGKYSLTVSVSAEWMNAEERAFPVIVDPTLTTPTETEIEDLYISSAAPDTSYGGDHISVSQTDTSYVKISNLDFLPRNSYVVSAELSLCVSEVSESGYVYAHKVKKPWDSTLTFNTVSASVGRASSNASSYAYISEEDRHTPVKFDITDCVYDWVEDKYSNYGIALKSVYGSSVKFSSYDSIFEAPILTVTFRNLSGVEDYLPYNTHSVGSKLLGNVNLANGNLVLTVPTLTTTDSVMPFTPTLTYNTALANLFNTNSNAQVPFYVSATGVGFKWNLRQSLIKKEYEEYGESKYYYVFSDGDGTEHVFYENNNGIYKDEDALGLELSFNDNYSGTYAEDKAYITDSEKNVIEFGFCHGGWCISGISDRIGNKVSFEYKYRSENDYYLTQPSKVYFTPAGESTGTLMLEIEYSGGSPSFIYNPASKEAVIFRYSQEYNSELSTELCWYLREVEYCQGKSSAEKTNFENAYVNGSDESVISLNKLNIEYNEKGYVTFVSDSLSESGAAYAYSGDKVSKVMEYKNGDFENLSNLIEFTYARGHCTVFDHKGSMSLPIEPDDEEIHYSLDRNGRVVSAYSTEFDRFTLDYAESIVYDDGENSYNSIREHRVVNNTSPNYITNGNFELLANNDASLFKVWTESENVSRYYSVENDGVNQAKFDLLPNATDYIFQYVHLPIMEIYTLSFDYSKFNAEDSKLRVRVENHRGEYPYVYFDEEIETNSNSGVASAKVYLSNHSLDEEQNVKITISVETGEEASSGGYILIDNVRFLNSSGNTSKEMVTLGGFEKSCIFESGSLDIRPDEAWFTEGETSFSWIKMDDGYFKIVSKVVGDVRSERYLKQRIYERKGEVSESKFNYNFLVSGFGWAPAAVSSENSKFALRLDVAYRQPSGEDFLVSEYFDFASGYNGWQHVSGMFSTDIKDGEEGIDYSCVNYVDIVCEYSYQANAYAHFDNVSVVMQTDEPYTKYTYNENGTLKSYENESYTEYYEYDSDKNLVTSADNKGNRYEYTYCENGLIKSERFYKYNFNESLKEYTYNSYGLCTDLVSTVISSKGNRTAVTKWDYSTSPHIFGIVISEEDSQGIITRYFYDENNARLIASVNQNSNSGTAYSYDAVGNIIMTLPANYNASTGGYTAVSDKEYVSYEYDAKNRLTSIITNSTAYNFVYDSFGNVTSISIGVTTLASYEYDEKGEKLLKMNYSNGLTEEYVYNSLDLLTEIWYNKDGVRTLAYSYSYNENEQLLRVDDAITGKSAKYSYDNKGNLISYSELDTADSATDYRERYTYLDDGKISKTIFELISLNKRLEYSYGYNEDEALTSLSILGIGTLSYAYDSFYRLTSLQKSFGDFTLNESYTYKEQDGITSNELTSYTSTVNGSTVSYTYTYDGNGNITKINLSTGEEIRYVYDYLGQLLREDNEILGYTFTYEYDNAGNITAKKKYSLTAAELEPENPISTDSYTYSDGAWGDLLTSFNGNAITYDGLGNPLSYYNGYTFTWLGKQLVGANRGETSFSFEYNYDGIRTSKTVNGTRTDYYLNGTNIVAEVTGGNVTVYIYDATGSVIGMRYHASSYEEGVFDSFWFEKNAQGDIIAVYNTNGTKLVSYVYDAWGNATVSYHNNGENTSAVNNPFRYRGYYYDKDLELYYLNSRYYDSNTARFINSDVYVSTGQGLLGNNMFAYCNNNPVNNIDPTGEFAQSIVGAILSGVIAFCMYYLEYSLGMRNWNWFAMVTIVTTNAAMGAFTWYLGLGGKFQKFTKLVGIAQKARISDKVVEAITNLSKGYKFLVNIVVKGASRKSGESWFSAVKRFLKKELGVSI